MVELRASARNLLTMTNLNEVPVREDVGRKTIARFQMQFRAAGFACLDILEAKEIDRVYCDFHDDFVIRKNIDSNYFFKFVQVKTNSKRNYQWSVNDMFGLKKKGQKSDEESLNKIKKSFAGKMLLHTINFNDSCYSVTFITNVQFDDDVETIIAELKKDEEFKSTHLKFLSDHFSTLFNPDETLNQEKVVNNLKKIDLQPGVKYINIEDNDFIELANSAIYKYSEIELDHLEISEIVENLIRLVEKKSFTKLIPEIDESDLNDIAGIGIDDLLQILSISKSAYIHLINGGDKKALKNASILQRKLEAVGATSQMIEFCTQKKVDWDIWLRDARHSIPEFDLNFLIEELNQVQVKWIRSGEDISWLQKTLQSIYSSSSHKANLSMDLLLGGIFSALVRNETR